jgi:threonine dehydrogenase-like Zn-dependent dehydrogenase
VGNDWSDAIVLLQYGRLNPDPLFTMAVPLEELKDVLHEMREDQSITKVFVSPELDKREMLGA